MKKYIILTLLAVLTLQCSDKKEETKIEDLNKPSNLLILNENQIKNIPVELIDFKKETIQKTQLLTAKTEVSPQNTVSITSPFGGYVSRISIIPGNKVSKGQVVVVLEDPQYIQMQEDYLTTKVLLEQASADYTRQKDLNAQQAASDKVLQQAKATKNSLLVKKSALEQKLRLMNINPSSVSVNNIRRTISVNAPINGSVSQIFANTGQYVSPADPILEIINPNGVLLSIKMFEKDLQNLKIGQSLKAFSNANPDKKLSASIVSISNQINPDGTLNVYAKIIDSQGELVTNNMFFNIELEVDSDNTFALPDSAIVEFEGSSYVFIEESKLHYRLIKVTTGKSSNGFIEIISPDLQSKKIVSKGSYQLLTALKNSAEGE